MASLPPTSRHPTPLVLIVDDVEDTRLIYAVFLKHRGFDVSVAGTAKAALGIVAERRPDVIVMDFSMPGTDGLAATRQLASDPTTAHIPVILLTGHVEMISTDAVKAAGARRLIIKPCLPEILEAEITGLLEGDMEFRRLRGTPPE
jgi:two-component system cell cycle response regulator DivK